jgi:hypothetical protein
LWACAGGGPRSTAKRDGVCPLTLSIYADPAFVWIKIRD